MSGCKKESGAVAPIPVTTVPPAAASEQQPAERIDTPSVDTLQQPADESGKNTVEARKQLESKFHDWSEGKEVEPLFLPDELIGAKLLKYSIDTLDLKIEHKGLLGWWSTTTVETEKEKGQTSTTQLHHMILKSDDGTWLIAPRDPSARTPIDRTPEAKRQLADRFLQWMHDTDTDKHFRTFDLRNAKLLKFTIDAIEPNRPDNPYSWKATSTVVIKGEDGKESTRRIRHEIDLAPSGEWMLLDAR